MGVLAAFLVAILMAWILAIYKLTARAHHIHWLSMHRVGSTRIGSDSAILLKSMGFGYFSMITKSNSRIWRSCLSCETDAELCSLRRKIPNKINERRKLALGQGYSLTIIC